MLSGLISPKLKSIQKRLNYNKDQDKIVRQGGDSFVFAFKINKPSSCPIR